ncbi:hypothetical protein FRB94_007305 [Tulasnella sp. JGI-2019a]|nr:hypothetical protein FRB94_007305 [Tulasnella sp. JGI-2019a]KAG9013290.1 hypothetical protein FRB93_000813 [Tulasnella sp. JGI-2019a]KAG9024219.1 hypothetical protein FRB95_011946 [Tulasnella sp. JGI-2019a]
MGRPTNQTVSIVATHSIPSINKVPGPNGPAHYRVTAASSWATSKIFIFWVVALQSLPVQEIVAFTNVLLPATMSAANEATPSTTNQIPSSRPPGEQDTAVCTTDDTNVTSLSTSTAAPENTPLTTPPNAPSEARMSSVLAALITAIVIALLFVTTWQVAMDSWGAQGPNTRTLDIRSAEIVMGPKNPTKLSGQKGGGTELQTILDRQQKVESVESEKRRVSGEASGGAA